MKFRFPLFLLCAAGLGASAALSAPVTMGEQPGGGILVPTNQRITPVGRVQHIENERPKDLKLSPDGKVLAVLAQSHLILIGADGTAIDHLPLKAGPLGLAWMPDSRSLFVTGESGEVYRVGWTGKSWKVTSSFEVAERLTKPRPVNPGTDAHEWRPASPEGHHLLPVEKPSQHHGNPQVTGLAVSPDAQTLYVALGIRNLIAVVNIATENVTSTVSVDVAPYRITLSPDGRTLFVANRGGRQAHPGEAVEYSAGTAVRIDPTTDAALRGAISIIQTKTLAATELEVGRQPSGMAVTHDGRTLYVANSDDDSVSVIDVATRRLRQTITLRPAQDPGFGQMPTDVALSGDDKFLYVSCGGENAVAVVSLPDLTLHGFIPTGWFPIALAERGGELYVASSKGIGARLHDSNDNFRVTGSIGTIQLIAPAERADLAALTQMVSANNHWNLAAPPARRGIPAVPVPEHPGEPSVFKHVIYIIKENHSYDLDLGDMPEGRGDKSLCLFGEEATPNEHAIARQFVLLDNTYTSGTNSADGHQWTDSAVANTYLEQNFDSYARSFPFNGGDPLAYSPAGFLWTSAFHAGKSVRVYGEFVNKPHVVDPLNGRRPTWSELWQDYQANTHKYEITAGTDNVALRPFLHPRYIGFPLIVSDQWRADQFLADLKTAESTGSFPALSILLLPSNHTAGTTPGMPTPRALVADNDLALGRIVEAISHSRFWSNTLILVIEDDSHFGLDHVDGHRTVAFCISPYTQRGAVVSEPYNHTSFVRTIGLVLGLPPMTRFDRTATSLSACFTDKIDLRPYTHVAAHIPLGEMNPPLAGLRGPDRRLAAACSRLDWSRVDRADPVIVARAAWRSQRANAPFPWRYFHPGKDLD